MSETEEEVTPRKKSEAPPPRRRPKKIVIPRRAPSIVVPKREIVYVTADKTTCVACPCYPKEERYHKIKKIKPCQQSPPSLYALAADTVDRLKYPHQLLWSEEDVANWIASIGLPQYQESFLVNHVNGLRLLMFENPSRLPEVNIHDFEHILVSWRKTRIFQKTIKDHNVKTYNLIAVRTIHQCLKTKVFNSCLLPVLTYDTETWPFTMGLTKKLSVPMSYGESYARYFPTRSNQKITSAIRQLYGTDLIKFARSIGLPFRRPLIYCTWFKSRTGPSWGIRQNWNRCDVLRCMKILKPLPPNLDHWDLVWYQKPDYPKTLFARIPSESTAFKFPQYNPAKQVCNEYTVPRKFRFLTGISESAQVIWMERRPETPVIKQKKGQPRRVKLCVPKDTRLMPKKIDPTGLTGKDLLLARRKMAKPKFLAK